jgi:RNA polymerase sigma factor (sigma-70 family)
VKSSEARKRPYECEPDCSRSEQAIHEASKSWNPEQWESYLQTLDVGLKESLVDGELSNRRLAFGIFDLVAEPCSEEISSIIQKLISLLTVKQKLVIEKYFFEGRTHSQIAKIMNVSRQRAFTLKKRAIRQLKRKAREVVGKSPSVEAQIFKRKEV